MSDRRVVITGLGAVSAAGVGAQPLWDALLGRRSCIRPIQGFNAEGFDCRIAGEVEDFSARKFVPKTYRKAVKVMARDIELAVAAADLAVRDAGWVTRGIDADAVDIDGDRVACNIGAGLICADLTELGEALATSLDADGKFDIKAWGSEGMTNLTPLWLLKYLPNMLACHVTIIHGLCGPSNTITCTEASSHLSVGEAWEQIARGAADAALAGGAESKLNPMGLVRQGMLNRLVVGRNDAPESACRPFDAAAAGSVIGEGGGLLVLEELQAAKARGATIYAELAGFSAASDPAGVDPTVNHCGNVQLAAADACRQAGVEPKELDLVIPNGSAVPGEDACEIAALSELLAGGETRVTPIAGAVGNCFAGAGALTLTAGCLAIKNQTIFPAVNFESPADGHQLNVPTACVEGAIDTVLTQAFCKTGQSAAIVLKRYRE